MLEGESRGLPGRGPTLGQKAEGEFRRLLPLLWLVLLCAQPCSIVFGAELEKEVTQAAEASAAPVFIRDLSKYMVQQSV